MDFRCERCKALLTTGQVAKQRINYATCTGDLHAGPFELYERALGGKQTRPVSDEPGTRHAVEE